MPPVAAQNAPGEINPNNINLGNNLGIGINPQDPPPPLPLPPIDNHLPFDPREISPGMQWVMHLLGPILGMVELMHRVAITLSDPSCYRFMALIWAIPDGVLGEAALAALHTGAHRIGAGWSTLGVPQENVPQPPAQTHVHLPAHVSPGILEGQYKFNASLGKFCLFHRNYYTAIIEMTNGPMQVANLSNYVTGKPGHDFAVVSDAVVKSLTSGGFFTKDGITPAEVDKIRRQLKPRVLWPSPPTGLEALDQIFDWIHMFINVDLAALLRAFVLRAAKAMEDFGPLIMCPLEELVRMFLENRAIPLFNRPSTVAAPVLAAVGLAADNFLAEQPLVTTLLTMARGRTGAPSNGLQRANNVAGGGGGGGGWNGAHAAAGGAGGPLRGPPRPGQQYLDPPPNKIRPLPFTDDIGRCPPVASRVALCYPTNSTFGRCSYGVGNCIRQHNWANVTAAEQRLVEDWLKLWLRKQQWTQYVRWSDNGGGHASWPHICG